MLRTLAHGAQTKCGPGALPPWVRYCANLRETGVKVVYIKSAGPHASKWFCTMQVAVLLTSDKTVKQPRLGIIFRGQGARLSKRRGRCLGQSSRRGVSAEGLGRYGIQRKVVEAHIEAMPNWSSRTFCSFSLTIWALRHQTTPWQKHRNFGVRTHFFPANCTDLIQPVDHHIGVNLKRQIGL